MKLLKSVAIKIRSYPALLILCWVLLPILTIDIFYFGKILPGPVRKIFMGVEKQWYDFLIRHESAEIIAAKNDIERAIHSKTYARDSQIFQRDFDSLSIQTRAPKDTAIIAIDEKTLTELGEWPIRRHHYAKLLDRVLTTAGARGVVLDIVFSEQGDRLPIQKLEEIGHVGGAKIQELAKQAIEAIDYDRELETTISKHKFKVVAGYISLPDEESKFKDYSNIFMPLSLRKHSVEVMKQNLIEQIPRINGGVYNHPGILNSIVYRGFFSVPTDNLDGLVRKAQLLIRYPMKFKDPDGVLSDEKVELFGSIDVEAFTMLNKDLTHFQAEGSYLVLKGQKYKRLNQKTRLEIKQIVQEAISRVADLSTFQRDLLEKIAEKTDFFQEEVYRGITLLIAQFTAGFLQWSDHPEEGFILNLLAKENELKEALLFDWNPEDRKRLFATKDHTEVMPFLEDLRATHSQLSSRLSHLFVEQILNSLNQEMVLLLSFSSGERQRILNEIKARMAIDGNVLQILFRAENLEDDEQSVRMENDSEIGINYYGLPNSFPVYSFVDVLKRDELSPKYLGYDLPRLSLEEALRNRVILVGPTAQGINDWRNTPINGQLDGVEVHAHALSNLREGNQILRGQDMRVYEILLLLILGIALPLLLIYSNAIWGAIVIGGLVISYCSYCLNAFSSANAYLYFVPVFLQSLGLYLIQSSYSYVKEQLERRKTRNAFQHYVNASVVDAVLRDPEMLKLGGQRKELSVLFSDVRSFTTISEGLDPETLVALMNEYLTEMTDLVLHYNGTLDKFIGDAVMAFWGAPIAQDDHPYRAVMTAIEMNKKVNAMFDDFKERYGVEIRIGIGINTGPAVVGNMGSRSRFDYTILGDTVNLGARLEGQTKSYGAELIVSETTYHHVKSWAATRFLDLIAVKGKSEPVRIYECPGVIKEMDQNFLEGLKKFEEAVDIYYMGRRFKEGIEVFESLKSYRGGQDVACDLYISRCKDFILNPPPEDWNGVFVATSK